MEALGRINGAYVVPFRAALSAVTAYPPCRYCDEEGRPFQNIRIHHVYVLDDPFPDPPQLEVRPARPTHRPWGPDRPFSPSQVPPSPEFKPDEDRLEADQPIVEAGRTQEEIEEEIAAKEAHSRQEVLEMIGDIPDADIRCGPFRLFRDS